MLPYLKQFTARQLSTKKLQHNFSVCGHVGVTLNVSICSSTSMASLSRRTLPEALTVLFMGDSAPVHVSWQLP